MRVSMKVSNFNRSEIRGTKINELMSEKQTGGTSVIDSAELLKISCLSFKTIF